jgi:hypothetical protein
MINDNNDHEYRDHDHDHFFKKQLRGSSLLLELLTSEITRLYKKDNKKYVIINNKIMDLDGCDFDSYLYKLYYSATKGDVLVKRSWVRTVIHTLKSNIINY